MSDGGYEVCILKGDDWQLVRMFDEGEKEAAIDEANHLFRSGERAVCVIWSKNDSVVFTKAQGGKSVKQNDVMANLSGKRKAGLYEDKKVVKKVPPGGAATARTKPLAAKTTASPDTPALTLHYLILGIGVGLSFLLFPFLALFGASMGTAAGFTAFGLVVSAATAYLLYLQHQQVEASGAPGTKKYADNHFKAKAALAGIFNQGRQKKWSNETNAMEGDSHFGLLLYMIGATKALSELYNIAEDTLMQEVITILGGISLMPASIQRSWSLVGEYNAYPRYATMMQRGDAAARRLFTNPLGDVGMISAFELWDNFDQMSAPDQRVAAILFTDIVNFTKSHQESGDAWMKDVVHAHNEIVRGAISSYQGREVKHTGDGIMASFSSVNKAIKAAMAMHRGIDMFNMSMPDRNFLIRIGISAGEPVYMDGDLFGTPVNMAARVLPNADGRQIAVAEDVPAQVPDEGYVFEALPEQELKGFEGMRSVFLLKWEETPQEVPASAEEQQPQTEEASAAAEEPMPEHPPVDEASALPTAQHTIKNV